MQLLSLTFTVFAVKMTLAELAHRRRMMTVHINIPTPKINTFCQRHQIRELALFGSVLREDFKPNSDVDVLIDFKPGVEEKLTLMELSGMQLELSDILEREVDLVLRDGLKPFIKDEVLNNLEVVYAV
jgi:predicted nucleotidyltransferase